MQGAFILLFRCCEGYSRLMEDALSGRIVDLRRRISLLQHDEKRLHWLLSSSFTLAKSKAQVARDLDTVVAGLNRLGAELSHAELGN